MNSDSTQSANHICLCLGSSCYSRGNRENLELLQSLIEDGSDVSFSLEGCLCQGECGRGPNVIINGKRFSGMSVDLFGICLEDLLGQEGT